MKQLVLLLSFFSCLTGLSALSFPLNVIRYYDLRYWTDHYECKRVDIGGYFFDYFNFGGRDPFGKKCDVLQIWNVNQNVLSMVKGFKPETAIGQLAGQLNTVPDDGIRGHYLVTGDLKVREAGLGIRYHLPHDLLVSAYLPIYDMSLRNIKWEPLSTEMTTFPDFLLAQLLTNNLGNNVFALSNGLQIFNNWQQTGVGDLVLLLQWIKNFPQNKPTLKNVLLNLRLGPLFPTGAISNPHHIFSIPFGHEGAFGLVFGGNLELNWKRYFVGGADFDFRYLFPSLKMRRIQTDLTQTDLIYLALTPASLKQGFIQRINLYLGLHNLFQGLIFDVGYQFQKQAESTLTLYNDAINNLYVNDFANASQRLQEWITHQFWFSAKYVHDPEREDRFLMPTFQIMYANTFKGTQCLTNKQFGFSITASY